MSKSIFCIAGLAVFASVGVAQADTRLVEGPEPVATYTVCNHSALYAVNDRAVMLKKGGRTFTDTGASFSIGYEPDVFMQTKHLVRHSYRSLSADGSCE